MVYNILTIFPQIIASYTDESILRRAQANGLISVNVVDIRSFATDKHRTVDDTPYGGGAGMIMKPEPIYEALRSVDALPQDTVRGINRVTNMFKSRSKKKRTVYLSPRGRQFDQRLAEEWAQLDELTLLCGRYEGVDHRVVEHMVDEEVSIGPYVLAGGELGALVILEAVARNISGVLGNPDSLIDETHAEHIDAEYPQYTKPREFLGWDVPDMLLSGDHKQITEWKKEMSRKNTDVVE